MITSESPPAEISITVLPVPTSLVIVNMLWFISLIFSLSAASISILVNQWLAEYRKSMMDDAEVNLRKRQYRYDNLIRWRVNVIMMIIPLLLQFALVLFLAGLVQLVWTLNPTIAVAVTVFVSIFLAFILATTCLPTIFNTCPYTSSQAHIFFIFWLWMTAPVRVMVKLVVSNILIPANNAIKTGGASREGVQTIGDDLEGGGVGERGPNGNLGGGGGRFLNTVERSATLQSSKDVYGVGFLDWHSREIARIAGSWFCLDARAIKAVKHEKASNVISMVGPIAINALARLNFIASETSHGGHWGECVLTCLNVMHQYYSLQPGIKIREYLFQRLTKLLSTHELGTIHGKNSKFARTIRSTSWSIIVSFADRFNTALSERRNIVPALIKFAHEERDQEKASPRFVEACLVLIRACSILPKSMFPNHFRDLENLLEELRTRIDQSRTGISHLSPKEFSALLARDLPALLPLAKSYQDRAIMKKIIETFERLIDIQDHAKDMPMPTKIIIAANNYKARQALEEVSDFIKK